MSTGSTVRSGQRRRAVTIGRAEWTPNLRAAYEAVVTTPRGPSCATTTGLPRSSGWRSISTET